VVLREENNLGSKIPWQCSLSITGRPSSIECLMLIDEADGAPPVALQ
jgi:hypothetical protein